MNEIENILKNLIKKEKEDLEKEEIDLKKKVYVYPGDKKKI